MPPDIPTRGAPHESRSTATLRTDRAWWSSAAQEGRDPTVHQRAHAYISGIGHGGCRRARRVPEGVFTKLRVHTLNELEGPKAICPWEYEWEGSVCLREDGTTAKSGTVVEWKMNWPFCSRENYPCCIYPFTAYEHLRQQIQEEYGEHYKASTALTSAVAKHSCLCKRNIFVSIC